MTPPEHAPTQAQTPNAPDGFTWLIHQALFILTPFFMEGAGGEEAYARAAAKELLASYRIASPEELQIVTECIVFAYAAMETLRQAKTESELSDHRRLRLRSNAAALSRASHRNRRSLDALRKRQAPASEPRQVPPESHPFGTRLDPARIMQDLQEKIAQHRECMATAHTQAVQTTAPLLSILPHTTPDHGHRPAAPLAAAREAHRQQGLAQPGTHRSANVATRNGTT